jgi:hypothetical protein
MSGYRCGVNNRWRPSSGLDGIAALKPGEQFRAEKDGSPLNLPSPRTEPDILFGGTWLKSARR